MAQLSFTEHPASVGENYGEHFCMASYFAGRMIAAGLACLVHAALPFVFTTTASRTVAELYTRMVSCRRRGARAPLDAFYQANFEI
jgi:hypothetical protein